MKITNEILKRIIKEEMDSTLKELVSGPGDFNNETEITPLKWTALEKYMGLGSAKPEEDKEAIENYFKNQNQTGFMANEARLDNRFGPETAEEIKTILRKKDAMQ